jgi:hypothetical protein
MRGHAMQVHASEIRSAGAKQSGNNVMLPQLLTAYGAFETIMAKLLSQNSTALCMRWSGASA